MPETVFSPMHPRVEAVDINEAVAEALAAIGPCDRLTVLVNDPQRHTSSRAVLESLLPRRPVRLRVLVAAGTHSFTPAQRTQFESSLLNGLPVDAVAWHECRSPELVSLGGAWRGHPWLLEPPPLLAIGSVEPHYFAGWTGAHKTATVGCCHHDDIQANHAHALEPSCRPGRLEGNPVYEGIAAMLAALEALQKLAAVNLIQAGRDVLAVAGGRALDSLRRLTTLAGEVFLRRVETPFDAVIAEVEGPLGRSFYQADKGIKNNEWAVRDGGTFILQAPCQEGIGQDHFVSLLRQAGSYDEAVSLVNQRGYRLGDHKAVRLRYLTDPARRNVQAFLVGGGVSPQDASVLGFRCCDSVEEALGARGIYANLARVLRIKDAGNLCALPAED